VVVHSKRGPRKKNWGGRDKGGGTVFRGPGRKKPLGVSWKRTVPKLRCGGGGGSPKPPRADCQSPRGPVRELPRKRDRPWGGPPFQTGSGPCLLLPLKGKGPSWGVPFPWSKEETPQNKEKGSKGGFSGSFFSNTKRLPLPRGLGPPNPRQTTLHNFFKKLGY